MDAVFFFFFFRKNLFVSNRRDFLVLKIRGGNEEVSQQVQTHQTGFKGLFQSSGSARSASMSTRIIMNAIPAECRLIYWLIHTKS